jgi:hypothetical protein
MSGPASTPRPEMPGSISSGPRSKTPMTELMQLRERVEGFVVPELQRQGELLATVLADLKNSGASEPGEGRTPEGGGQAAER